MHQGVAAVAEQRVAAAGVAGSVLGADLPHRIPGTEVGPAGVQRHHADVELGARPGTFPSPRSRPTRRGWRRTAPCSGRTKLASVLRPSQAARRGCGDVGRESAPAPSATPRRAPRTCRCSSSSGRRPGSAARSRRRASRRSVATFISPSPAARSGCSRSRFPAGPGVMPRITKAPPAAARTARRSAAVKAASSPTVWSAGVTTSTGSRPLCVACSAASVMAGAVLRPIGSSSTAGRRQRQSSRSWSSTRKRCSSLPTTHGPADGDVRCGQRLQAQRRLLEQALLAVQRQELLRIGGARQRPQAGAAAAGHDHGLQVDRIHWLGS